MTFMRYEFVHVYVSTMLFCVYVLITLLKQSALAEIEDFFQADIVTYRSIRL